MYSHDTDRLAGKRAVPDAGGYTALIALFRCVTHGCAIVVTRDARS
jgi:hypothetical protein